MNLLMERLGYTFQNMRFLEQALTHASYHNGTFENNEKMEFLGDRVLGLTIADMLYQHQDIYTQGAMAVIFNHLVCRETCATIAHMYKLEEVIRIGPSERKGAIKKAILADACEALIGAIYLDTGWDSAQRCVQTMWQEHLTHALTHTLPVDPKTLLQQWAQKRGLPLPIYTITQQYGQAHAPTFTIMVQIGTQQAQAQGTSKKEAERHAAQLLLEILSCPK